MTVEERNTMFLTFLTEQNVNTLYWKNLAKQCVADIDDIHKKYTEMISNSAPGYMFMHAFVFKYSPEGGVFWSMIYQKWMRKFK